MEEYVICFISGLLLGSFLTRRFFNNLIEVGKHTILKKIQEEESKWKKSNH